MTILTELAALYDRMAARGEAPKPGYSMESIGGEVVLDLDGNVVEIRPLLAPDEKGKMRAASKMVPAAVKRASGVIPNLFWDKTAYALGVVKATDEDGKPLKDADGNAVAGQGKRTAREHAAFGQTHSELLAQATDPGLIALRAFLGKWDPTQYSEKGYPLAVLDENVIFRLEGARAPVHNAAAVAALLIPPDAEAAPCLITGTPGPTARLHPSIKGVAGAQSSGASLVSFNDRAYESHGKSQGENAPVSQEAAFAYGTALNALLARGSGHSIRIGDATAAFWTRAADPDAEAAAGAAIFLSFQSEDDDAAMQKLRGQIEAVAAGRWSEVPEFDPETQVFILGLAPNAARLSVRFWYPGTLEDFGANVKRFWDDLSMFPSPFPGADGTERPPKPWALLYELAAQGEAKNIPPLLGGGLIRAVLTGAPYPRTLLSGVIGRIRAEAQGRDRYSDGRRAAIIRAVLTRNFKQEVPMALDETSTDTAYVLGRLFGAYAYAEKSNAERGASIRDKYMGGASANPGRIFPLLMRGYEHNLSGMMKQGGMKAGAGVKADKAVSAILALLPGGGDLPLSLGLEEQGRFFIGFYHQISAFYARPEDAAAAMTDTDTGDTA